MKKQAKSFVFIWGCEMCNKIKWTNNATYWKGNYFTIQQIPNNDFQFGTEYRLLVNGREEASFSTIYEAKIYVETEW